MVSSSEVTNTYGNCDPYSYEDKVFWRKTFFFFFVNFLFIDFLYFFIFYFSFYFILFYFILFYFILFCFVLFCFVLCYFILFYFILFYFILFSFYYFIFLEQRMNLWKSFMHRIYTQYFDWLGKLILQQYQIVLFSHHKKILYIYTSQ